MKNIKTKKTSREVVRFEKNPFLPNLSVKTKNQHIRVSKIEQEKDENILINPDTGEVAYTHMVTYKEVDKEEFVKVFTRNIGMMFNLKPKGIKVLNILMFAVQNYALGKDKVKFDKFTLEEFKKSTNLKIEIQTFQKGINELIDNQIVARTKEQGYYFINPNFIFNGDRFAFTTAFKKKKESTKIDCNQEEISLE